MVIYVDVLIIINFMINSVLLRSAALMTSKEFAPARGFLAAFLGALSSLIIFLPFYGVWFTGFMKLFACIAMVMIAFPHKGIIGVLKDAVVLFFASFILSGIMMWINVTLKPVGMSLYNGVIYFDIGALALVGTTVLSFLGMSLFSFILSRRMPKELTCVLTIYYGDNIKILPALIDSGNNLTEPFSGLPVIICSAKAMENIMPQNVPLNGVGFRVVPYNCVGYSGLLNAFSPKKVVVTLKDGKQSVIPKCYIALDESGVYEEYKAIINSQLIS